MNEQIDLSFYVHLPWCLSKCPYCDFNSHKAENGLIELLDGPGWRPTALGLHFQNDLTASFLPG